MSRERRCLAGLFSLLLLPMCCPGQSPSFTPDGTFKGSDLKAWHTVGGAQWKAENGEIEGQSAAGHGGGWIFLDKSYQDTGVYVSFRCQGPCDTGVLLRAQSSGDGIRACCCRSSGRSSARIE